ncbi:hypothetical protein MRX96_059185 [Rhipicephalus microplus]
MCTNGEIPLHFAAREGHLRTTKLLLEDNSISDLLNKEGESPLHVAVKNCHFPVVEALLDDWEKKNSDPEEKKKLANQKNMEGENSLHYAATITEKQKHYATEDRDIMRILLKHGGRRERRDEDDDGDTYTPLLQNRERGDPARDHRHHASSCRDDFLQPTS